MPTLPDSGCSLLVRTDFTNDVTWHKVSHDAQRENEDGFHAYVQPVNDRAFDGATWRTVKAAVPANDRGAMVLFIADSTALTAPDHPILVVDPLGTEQPFRCVPSSLWSVENNLNIANMDWYEFACEVDTSGVFRGFT